MFVSTTIPSFKLNSTRSMGMIPYEFTIPYNFVAGRNIDLSFSFEDMTVSNPTGVSQIPVRQYLRSSGNSVRNRYNIVIPDNVTTYTISMELMNFAIFNTTNHPYESGSIFYTINITCDVVNNKIVFAPISFRTDLTNPDYITWIDNAYTSAVLLVISTNS